MSHAALLTAADRRVAARLVRVRPLGAKGLGVLAATDLPAWTFVAPYPGVRYTKAQHAKRVDAGRTDGKFVVDFYRPDVNGVPRSGYVLDPGAVGGGGLHPRFRGAVAPLVNEPDARSPPNLTWVWNLPRYRMELWTAAPVRAGQELTLCYGTGGGYRRDYRTSCVVDGVEPQLHVVTRAGARPVPYSSLGSVGVRDAIIGAARSRRRPAR